MIMKTKGFKANRTIIIVKKGWNFLTIQALGRKPSPFKSVWVSGFNLNLGTLNLDLNIIREPIIKNPVCD